MSPSDKQQTLDSPAGAPPSAPTSDVYRPTDPIANDPPRQNFRPGHLLDAAPSRVAPPPAGTVSPAGTVVGPDGQTATFINEQQHFDESMKESHMVPVGVLALGAILAMAIPALSVIGEGGVVAAVIVGIGSLVALAVGILVSTGVGFLVGKMFAADWGSPSVLILRFAAVTAGYTVALGGLTVAMGPIFALFGNGITVIIVALASGLIGTWFYGLLRERLPHD